MTSNGLSAFDRIYLINLEKRKDRLEKWMANNKFILAGLDNFEIVKAIDGNDLDYPDWKFSKGALGCLESHLNILKDAKEKGYGKILIFEDDFECVKNFNEIFIKGWQSLPENWDMLYLFAYDYTPPLPYNDELMKCSATLCTVSYAINSSIIDSAITLLEKRNHAVDVVYGHLHFIVNAFKFKKNICEHDDGFSDVEDNFVVHKRPTSFPKRVISKLKHLKTKLFK